MRRFAINFISISLALTVSSPTTYALTGSALEDLHMSSEDTKEKQLLDQIQSARHSEGIESAAAFERLLDLVQYYFESNAAGRLSSVREELRKHFAKLKPGDQETFAPRLVSAAQKELNYQREEASEVFYTPVVESCQIKDWKNKKLVVAMLNILACKLLDTRRWLAAEKLFTVALSVEPENLNTMRNLAWVHTQLQMYDRAALEYQKVVAKPDESSSFHDYVQLANIFVIKGDKTGLRSLYSDVQKRLAKTPPSETDLPPIAEIISALSTAKMYGESLQLAREIIVGAPPGGSMYFNVTSIVTACGSNWTAGHKLYKFWTDDLKQRLGASNVDWINGMVARACYYRNNNMGPEMSELEVELEQAHPQPGDVEQRLSLLCLYRVIFMTKSTHDLSRLAELLQNVPHELLSIRLYGEGADLYSNLNMNGEALECKQKGVAEILLAQKPEDAWRRPFFEVLVGSPKAVGGDSFGSFATQIESAIRSPSEYNSVDNLLSGQLARQGHISESFQFCKEQLINLGARPTTKEEFEKMIDNYILTFEGKTGLATPEAKLVFSKRAYSLILKGSLKSKWKKPIAGSGITKFEFVLTHSGTSIRKIQSSDQKSQDVLAQKSLEQLYQLPSLMPLSANLRFKVTFDQETGDVNVS